MIIIGDRAVKGIMMFASISSSLGNKTCGGCIKKYECTARLTAINQNTLAEDCSLNKDVTTVLKINFCEANIVSVLARDDHFF